MWFWPRWNAIFVSNNFRHFEQSASWCLHFLQFGKRGFCQVFVRVDGSPLLHFAIKNQVHTPGMQTLWHIFFCRRSGPLGIYCARVLWSFTCFFWHLAQTLHDCGPLLSEAIPTLLRRSGSTVPNHSAAWCEYTSPQKRCACGPAFVYVC